MQRRRRCAETKLSQQLAYACSCNYALHAWFAVVAWSEIANKSVSTFLHRLYAAASCCSAVDSPLAAARVLKVPDVAIPMQHSLLKRISAFQSKEVSLLYHAQLAAACMPSSPAHVTHACMHASGTVSE